MPNEELETAIARQQLPPFLVEVLRHLAEDGDGLSQDAAPWFLASLTNRPVEECNQAIIDLLGRGALLRVDGPHGPRLLANYQNLQISEETRLQLIHRTAAFETLGAPHSPKAMATLDALFRNEPRPIYLGLEVTSHRVFRELDARASAGRETVFILPRKRDLPSERQTHYDEVTEGWLRFIREGRRTLRQHVKLLVTGRPFPHLYTSLLSHDLVRLDLYRIGDTTTRRGEMIQASLGSSLYQVVYQQFTEALATSRPLPRLWPIAWICSFFRRNFVGLMAAALALAFARVAWASILVALFLGVAANALYEWLRTRQWPPLNIYER